MELLCPWESALYFVYSSNVPALFFYSHIPAMFAALFAGFLVFYKSGKQKTGVALLVISLLFSAWCFFDLLLWATNRPDVVMFFWSLQILFEPLVYLVSFYLVYVFIRSTDLPFIGKALLFFLYAPVLFLLPSSYNLEGVNLVDCTAIEGFIAQYYTYVVEGAIILAIITLTAIEFRKASDRIRKAEIATFSIGVMLFLIAFSSGNLIGSFTNNWDLAQIGLIGMPIFIGSLAYLIVQFHTFNIKLLGAQALVIALVALIASELLFVRSFNNRVLIMVTLAFAIAFGFLLVRSVKREVSLREELEIANKQQENLLHFISHEVKGYLTESQAGFASIVEGDLGQVPESVKTMSTKALDSVRKGVRTVMEILDASNMKKGTVNYKKDRFDLQAAVLDVVAHLKRYAEEKGLSINVSIGDGNYLMEGDEEKIRQHVVRNLIDNAIKYTLKGVVEIRLTDGDKLRFSVKDSGVGITLEDKKNLFTEGGHGKDSIKVNVHSTGYGLFIAKQVVEAHGGKIWAESEGQGKGSTFIVEFPAIA